MNNTITIDNVPSGFELTGEYRRPNKGEWCLLDYEAYKADSSDMFYARPILRKLEPPEPPKGYELTGEYREPKLGEEYVPVMFGVLDSDQRRWILRKVWQAPAWMQHYKGCWLFQRTAGDWAVSKNKPYTEEVGDFKRYYSLPHHVMFNAVHLAELHGDKFTPPPTTCMQM